MRNTPLAPKVRVLLSLLLLSWGVLATAQQLTDEQVTQPQLARGCDAEDHRAFDFWVGTWDVENADGSPAGRNVIVKIQGNCVLKENWSSATPGYTGTSYSFYNRKVGQWQQLWIDNQGASLELIGNRSDNKMILRSVKASNKDGSQVFNRITWSVNSDGSVRQLWEKVTESKEGEITIVAAFDGLYRKAAD